jgi:uncharacterized OB-fold protein
VNATPVAAEARLRYQRCAACGHAWYFRRDFCPACATAPPQTLDADGAGRLYAVTLVHRAPAEEFKALVPYSIVLVDMREGFRVMGHAEPGLALDAPVRCQMRSIAGRLLPFFVKDPDVA